MFTPVTIHCIHIDSEKNPVTTLLKKVNVIILQN